MKITKNEDGTYALVVSTDEDKILFQALTDANMVGQELKYGGRHGEDDDPDFHLYLLINEEHFVLREDGDRENLAFVRDSMFYGGRPTVVSLTDENVKTITLGITKCKGCGTWKHGFTAHCSACVDACEHTFERDWIISPTLGQVVALACTKCGRIDSDDFKRLKEMDQIDRLVEVADATGTQQFIYPAGAKSSEKYDLGVEVHIAQEALRAAKE